MAKFINNNKKNVEGFALMTCLNHQPNGVNDETNGKQMKILIRNIVTERSFDQVYILIF